MRGKFIVIDGSDGSGKTTQLDNIVEYLTTSGIHCYRTQEPGGTDVGRALRHLLLKDTRLTPTPETELLLIMASRCEHLKKEILPRLVHGEWVVSDRFNDATYAYQGGGRKISAARIHELERYIYELIGASWIPDTLLTQSSCLIYNAVKETLIQGKFQPDISFLLMVPQAVIEERIAQRRTCKDRIEKEDEMFFKRVQQGYKERSALPHVKKINACGSEEEVFARIQPYLDALIEENN